MPILAGVECTEPSESQLVERFRRTGEGRYFETLYLRTRRRVYSRCLAILKDGEGAEDQTHETFLRAYDQFSSLQGDNFSGWVYQIATNLSLNRLRDELNRQQILKRSVTSPSVELEGTEERLIRRDELGKAGRVLATLNEEQRTVLTLKYVQGYSYSEIEQRTGYSYAQIRSYLQNARRNFQIRWTQQSGSGGVSHE